MFECYREIVKQYKKLPLKYERRLIGLAKKGNSSAQEELLFHLLGFFLFRIETNLSPAIIRQYGEDILQDCLVLGIGKIRTYNLRYRNKKGKFQPVHFSTYIWKSVTGLLVTYTKTKKEICFSDLSDLRIKRIE
ncbi:MAG: hypothetical protein AUJ85_08235 [Elusimicrobia bacterium CG1_02_37_114]|nr:MAG: hypothetical protein AUJ85_08235 [Elusimicrobia bacterium CG1_02_37_114]PIV52339.1 MAG: hypothetical protein COS17_09785 [Elusimicrobia bacterium CG02_land_8_20_14_3_00_37_13]PIZ12589.1 MAG: hypothetical protein COY53_09335 [Elusimicrobia bacterium CG_4_10_14_0_8_um_filter_37_32]